MTSFSAIHPKHKIVSNMISLILQCSDRSQEAKVSKWVTEIDLNIPCSLAKI